MEEKSTKKIYDLEERTFQYAKKAREFFKKLSKIQANLEDGRQFIRSTGSVGANYIEANESISVKDFIHRIKICRKEAKESLFWFKLIDTGERLALEDERRYLIQESIELMNIFGSMIRKKEKG